MNGKPAKIIALASLGVLVIVGWQAAAAKDKKEKSSAKPVLPEAAAAAIKTAFPKAAVVQVKREKEGVVLYEVKLTNNGKELEVDLAADGQIVEVGEKVAQADLPDAVAKTLAKLAGEAKVNEIEKEEIHAVVKLVKLDKPQVVYEADFVQNGKEVEVKIAADGTLMGKEVKEDNDDEDDDDGDEKEVSIDQVPAAVKATILKEAGGNKIEEIEVQTRGGKTVYEADWKANGKEIEIKVAPDGTVLGREVEEDEGDDD